MHQSCVVDGADTLARIAGGQIRYKPDVERTIDFAGVRKDAVVVMGEEVVRPVGDAPHASKLVRRRFTDVWTITDAVASLAIRQATVTSADEP
jgi:hypothetical protein